MPWTGRKLSDNARQAIGDSSSIAYLGELTPGASADTIGITNAEDLLQVSPTDTAVELTQVSPAVPNSPTQPATPRHGNPRSNLTVNLVPYWERKVKGFVSRDQPDID